MKRQDYLKTLHLTDAERSSLTERLNSQSSALSDRAVAGKAERRVDRRWDFVQGEIPVTVEHLGGGISKYLVWSRNLSAGGIAFLHGGYLHSGSRCRIDLKRLDGQTAVLIGVIVACRHVEGCNHEVCVKFDQRINPADFRRMSACEQAGAAAHVATASPSAASAVRATDALVIKIKESAEQLRKALSSNEREVLRGLCQSLKDTAAGHELSNLGLAASNALRSLDASESIEQMTELVKQLVQMCEKLAAPGNPEKKAEHKSDQTPPGASPTKS